MRSVIIHRRFGLTLAMVLALVVCLPVEAAMSAKYVFLFIGDGMAIAQRVAAENFSKSQGDGALIMNQFRAHGITTTHANDRFITDSAAATTAMACGVKTNIGVVGLDPAMKPVESMAEKAKKKGMKVGIVSSVSIDHATPAGFYAHQPSRDMYHEISMDLAHSDFDYFAGGGLLDPEGRKSKNPLGNALEVAKQKGYRIVKGKMEFENLKKGAGKVIAFNPRLPDRAALPYAIDTKPTDIELVEFTRKGIELLEGPDGFFLMVEGGKIDWACHANDAATAIKDILALDEAVKAGFEFYKAHPDETLIVVTGDHECGGLSLGIAETRYETNFGILKNQTISFKAFSTEVLSKHKETHSSKARFEDMIPLMKQYFGFDVKGHGPLVLTDDELEELRDAFIRSMSGAKTIVGSANYLRYGEYDPFTAKLTRLLNQRAGLGWTSHTHTGSPVSTSAAGVGAGLFNGFYDNTDVAKKIMSLF